MRICACLSSRASGTIILLQLGSSGRICVTLHCDSCPYLLLSLSCSPPIARQRAWPTGYSYITFLNRIPATFPLNILNRLSFDFSRHSQRWILSHLYTGHGAYCLGSPSPIIEPHLLEKTLVGFLWINARLVSHFATGCAGFLDNRIP